MGRAIKLHQNQNLEIAKEIIHLDQKRDALYEELVDRMGSKAELLLRAIENSRIYEY